MNAHKALMTTVRANARMAIAHADRGALAVAVKLLRDTAEILERENLRRFKLLDQSEKLAEKKKS